MGYLICQKMVLILKIVIEIGNIVPLCSAPIKGLISYI